jgi:hypothetical protein
MPPTLPEPGPRNVSPLRVFFALWPDAGTRDALSALARDTAAQAGVAPVDANSHLTSFSVTSRRSASPLSSDRSCRRLGSARSR